MSALDKVWSWNCESTGHRFDVLDLSKLSGVSSVSITSSLTSDSDNSGMDGAGNAVFLLEIDFWKMESFSGVVSVVIHDIFFGGLIDQLSHSESLDGLILWANSVAVETVNDIRMSLVLLSSSVISSL